MSDDPQESPDLSQQVRDLTKLMLQMQAASDARFDLSRLVRPFAVAYRYARQASVPLLTLGVGVVAGWWMSGGVSVGPGRNDVLSQSYDADRATQVQVLRELARQPFDGSTDDGRKQAGEWFNAQRFRNRAGDFGAFSDTVAEAIAANAEAELAAKLEGK